MQDGHKYIMHTHAKMHACMQPRSHIQHSHCVDYCTSVKTEQKLHRSVRIAALFQGLRHFSKDCGAFSRIAVLFPRIADALPVKTWRVLPNCCALAKIVARLTKNAAISFPHKYRANHKSVACFLSKRCTNMFN